MSAVATVENAALTSIIDEATAAGISVVGAADEDGARITSSNYVFCLDRL